MYLSFGVIHLLCNRTDVARRALGGWASSPPTSEAVLFSAGWKPALLVVPSQCKLVHKFRFCSFGLTKTWNESQPFLSLLNDNICIVIPLKSGNKIRNKILSRFLRRMSVQL